MIAKINNSWDRLNVYNNKKLTHASFHDNKFAIYIDILIYHAM